MKRRLVLTIRNLSAYHWIYEDAQAGKFKGFDFGFSDARNGEGFIYFRVNEKITFENDYLCQLAVLGCDEQCITQNLIPS